MKINVGIDIGTYSIKVAVSKNNENPEIILDEMGADNILNIITFGENRQIGYRIGESQSLDNTIQSINKFIYPKRDTNLKHFCSSYKEFEKNVNEFNFQMQLNGEKTLFKLEQILAMFLSKIKLMIKEEFSIIKYFISVPDFYDMKEKSIVKDACEIAGLTNYNLIKRSTGYICHFLNQKNEDIKEILGKNYIFVDFGYSYISIYYISIKNYSAECVYTDFIDIGVCNFDDTIMEYLINSIFFKTKKNFLQKNKKYFKILSEVQKGRIQLSENNEILMKIEDLEENFNYEEILKRSKFEDMNSNLISKIHIFLIESKMKAEQNEFDFKKVSEIQKIGGGSRIPFFNQTLESCFEGIPIKKNMDFLEGLAKGNASLNKVSEKFEIVEKLDNDILIEAYNRNTNKTQTSILLEKNTPYQMKVEYVIDETKNLEIRIFSKNDHVEKTLFEFQLASRYLQPIYFVLDKNGLLFIENLDKLQNNSVILFYKSFFGLDLYEIDRFKEREINFVKNDNIKKEIEKNKYDFESYLYNIMDEIEKEDKFLEEIEKINLKTELKIIEDKLNMENFNKALLKAHKFKLIELVQFYKARKNKMNFFDNLKSKIPDYLNFLQNFDMNYSELLLKAGDLEYSKISKSKLACLNLLKKFKILDSSDFSLSLLDSIDVKDTSAKIINYIKFLQKEIVDLKNRI